ncbi:MAG: hypothetical protein AAB886_02230, partial [Patescibacteria group bacterium]
MKANRSAGETEAFTQAVFKETQIRRVKRVGAQSFYDEFKLRRALADLLQAENGGVSNAFSARGFVPHYRLLQKR